MKLSNVRSSMEEIHFRAEFTIEEGKIEEYKKLVQDMSRAVEANEPDTTVLRITYFPSLNALLMF